MAGVPVAPSVQARKGAAVKIQDRSNEIVTFIPVEPYSDVAAWSSKVSGIVKSLVTLYWNIEKK